MNNILDAINHKFSVLFIAWVSITFGQVFYKLAERPGELLSSLIITTLVIGLISYVLVRTLNLKGHRVANTQNTFVN